jgi:hypothetical protein
MNEQNLTSLMPLLTPEQQLRLVIIGASGIVPETPEDQEVVAERVNAVVRFVMSGSFNE